MPTINTALKRTRHLTINKIPSNSGSAQSPSEQDAGVTSARSEASEAGVEQISLSDVLTQIEQEIAPSWPLKDMVAVNPFVGLTQHNFLEVRELLRQTSDSEMLLSLEYFQEKFKAGELTEQHLAAALNECTNSEKPIGQGLSVESLKQFLNQPAENAPDRNLERVHFSAAEIADQSNQQPGNGGQSGSHWGRAIVNEVSKFCSVYFDQGQAVWGEKIGAAAANSNTNSNSTVSSLFQMWRAFAQYDLRIELAGVKGFRRFLSELPSTAEATIEELTRRLELPSAQRVPYFRTLLGSVAGFASFAKYESQQLGESHEGSNPLVSLLAMRLTYDAALVCLGIVPKSKFLASFNSSEAAKVSLNNRHQESIQARYVMQVACEIAYRNQLVPQLETLAKEASIAETQNTQSDAPERPSSQMVFCIDVRSEVFRRHLESVTENTETMGFAGFFGVAIEYVHIGNDSGAAQCPVLLSPAWKVRESSDGLQAALGIRSMRQRLRTAWKQFQVASSSCFSFVESCGFAYAWNLLANSMARRPIASPLRYEGVATDNVHSVGPTLEAGPNSGIPLEQRIALGQGIVKNLSLTTSIAKLFVFCGHESKTKNNPFRASLDCGACGGHSGESNARVAAIIMNDPEVRKALAESGVVIPEDTIFLGAVHNTTNDEVTLFDTHAIPETHREELKSLQLGIQQAGQLTRLERSGALGSQTAAAKSVKAGGGASHRNEADIFRRALDWSEVRPEWGLAGNAAFVVAPRSRTSKLKLDGRSFLHDYRFEQDTDYSTLELIMTAPMVVTNWINLQYYASSVDNVHFGTGNKVLHNVVGTLGVFEGNGGDLRCGLPWQSVHNGERLQHEPLRLLVIIEAPREAVDSILAKHENIRQLVDGGWLNLNVLEGSDCYRRASDGAWSKVQSGAETAAA